MMNLAENLLNSLPNSAYENSRIAGSGSEEEHIVVDETRTIKVPSSLRTIAVKGDKDVETVTIDCIRYWDGNDLSTFTVFINYTLPNGDDRTYVPESINVADDTISFDWVIGRSMTGNSGQLTFWIVAKKLNEDETLDKQWSSFKNSECSIADGGSDEIYEPSNPEDVDLVGQAISAASRATIAAETANSAAEQAKDAADRAEEAAERAEQAGGSAIILTKTSTGADLKNAGVEFLENSRQVLFEAVNTENNTIYCLLVSIWNNIYYYFLRPDTRQIIKVTFVSVNQQIGEPQYMGLGDGSGGGDVVTPKFQVVNNILQVSYDNGDTFEDLFTFTQPEDGATPIFRVQDGYLQVSYGDDEWDTLGELLKGDAGNITINGTELKFFTGTKAEYDALSDEEKENLFAIITDDPTQIGLIDSIYELLEWKQEQQSQQNIYSYPNTGVLVTIVEDELFEIGKLYHGKTLDDIVGVGLEIWVESEAWTNHTDETVFRLSSGRTSIAMQDRTNESITSGGYVLPFTLSSNVITVELNGENALIAISADIEICSSVDGTVYVRFKRGFCRNSHSEGTTISNITGGEVKFRKLYYWFA